MKAYQKRRLGFALILALAACSAAWLFVGGSEPYAMGHDYWSVGYNSITVLGFPAILASMAVTGNVHQYFNAVFWIVFLVEWVLVGYLLSIVFIRPR